MIRIERPKGSMPKGFSKAALTELRANRIALKNKNKQAFGVYSSAESKWALTKIFGRKCVFCESLLVGTQPGDVEHYRPKGKVVVGDSVNGKKVLPGYFWLAARWSNLLISCADCNRPRSQLDHDDVARVIGKANFFPIADESKRAAGPGGISLEEPLLLNPCVDEPAIHLEFKPDGRIEPVSLDGVPSGKGVATIKYCGLARLELLQMRARHCRIVMAAIRHTVIALEAGHDPGTDLDDLVCFLDPHEAYVALTRSLIRTHMSEFLDSLGLDDYL